MGLQEINSYHTNQNISTPPADSNQITPSSPLLSSTISKGKSKDSSASDSIKTVWDYIKLPFMKVWEFVEPFVRGFWNWIKWIGKGCPKEKSPKEIVYEIITKPKETAKRYAGALEKNVSEFITGVLLDHSKFKKMRTDSEKKWHTFLSTLGKECSDTSQLFIGSDSNIIQSLKAILDPRKKALNNFFSKLADGIKKNPDLFCRTLPNFKEKILNVIGKEEKENNKPMVKNIRKVFSGYLSEAVEFIKKNPKKYEQFIDSVYALDKFQEDKIVKICEDHLSPPGEYSDSLKEVFRNFDHVSEPLADPTLFFDEHLKGKEGIKNLSLAFYQSVLEVITPEEIDTFIEAIGNDFPLLTGILQEFRERSDKERREIAKKLPEAIETLKELKTDFDNLNTSD